MYAREVQGTRLNFAVSGKLWKRSLIMIDEETKTLWSQLLGKAMEGELKGTTLVILPSSLTSWGNWKKSYPDTSVIKMRRTSKRFRNDYYKNPGMFVVGLSKPTKAKAWPFDLLMKQPLLNDRFDDQKVVVHFNAESGAAHIYRAILNGKEMSFEFKDGKVRDKETSSLWDLTTGTAASGKLAGKSLEPMPAIPSFRNSWDSFYPKSEYYTGSSTDK